MCQRHARLQSRLTSTLSRHRHMPRLSITADFGLVRRSCGPNSVRTEHGRDCRTTRLMIRLSDRSCFGGGKAMTQAEPYPKLKITGKRLDSSAPPVLLADHASNGCQEPEQPFMVVGINLPTLGCWEITGQYHDAQVTYVVWVTE